MNENYLETMRTHGDLLPTCAIYSELLSIAETTFGITRNQARERYGKFTNNQWLKLLSL